MENAKIIKALQDLQREIQELKLKAHEGENTEVVVQAKPKLAVGQVWKNGYGEKIEIVDFVEGSKFPWVGSEGDTYKDCGSYWEDGNGMFDLMELISDAPDECNPADTKPSIPKPLTKKPLMGGTYYTLSRGLSHSVWYEWCDSVSDKIIFDNGLAFETGKEATEAAKFMLQAWKQALKDSEN